MTLERIDRRLLDLILSLARFVPPAAVVDNYFYSSFVEGKLLELLRSRRVDTLVITGAETEFAYWRQFLAGRFWISGRPGGRRVVQLVRL
jgi:hypothetical protein